MSAESEGRGNKAIGAPLEVEISLVVTRFQDVLDPAASGRRLTEFEMTAHGHKGVWLDAGSFQKKRDAKLREERGLKTPPEDTLEFQYKKHTIQVPAQGAILRFNIVAEDGNGPYGPVGISFKRVDDTVLKAVAWSTGTSTEPFKVFALEAGVLSIRDIPLRGVIPNGEVEAPPRITYEFAIFIQRQSDGAIGIIDPYIENENVK
jgi:hypothetical protein